MVKRPLNRMRRAVLLWFPLFFGAALLVGAGAATPAHAVGNRTFDPVLSLTGGTATSEADPVPDPGPTHPPRVFEHPNGVAVDEAGDIYVLEPYETESASVDGRIDIFDAQGHFLTEISNLATYLRQPPKEGALGVDSVGNVYVLSSGGAHLWLFRPSSYPPSASVSYGSPTEVPIGNEAFEFRSMAVDPTNDHLFLFAGFSTEHKIVEYGSAAEGNPFLEGFGAAALAGAVGDISATAVNGNTNEVFVSLGKPDRSGSEIYVFDASRALKTVIDGSETPGHQFFAPGGALPLAADPATGELIVSDILETKHVYRFVPTSDEGYEYIPDPELEQHFTASGWGYVAVAPPEALNAGHVFVTNGNHLFAFSAPTEVGPPAISSTSFRDVSETEATLAGAVSADGRSTRIHFEYVDEAHFLESGFAGAVSTPAQEIGSGKTPIVVSQGLADLTPGTVYHFRIVAENCGEAAPSAACLTAGEHEEAGAGGEIPYRFATYPTPPTPSCSGEGWRAGPSALLPDCRAYERVSPGDSEGRSVAMTVDTIAPPFPTRPTTADGEAVAFETVKGAFPGFVGNGKFDRYLATRGLAGWSIQIQGPTGAQAEAPEAGGISADLQNTMWVVGGGTYGHDEGNLGAGSHVTTYVRRSDGRFERVGPTDGSSEDGPSEILGRFISNQGDHVIFTKKNKSGVYDRTLDGSSHLVSLLPGDVAIGPGEEAVYRGASADGSAIAFQTDNDAQTVKKMFVRLDDERTLAVDESSALAYAGLSDDGSVLTYVKDGNIFSFDTSTGSSSSVGSGGQSTVVNVSADGSHVYFISPKRLTPGSGPTIGKDNLYAWDAVGSQIAFVATVTNEDVAGESQDGVQINGLGLLTQALATEDTYFGPANSDARTTPDGRYLVFGSRADLTGQTSGGKLEVFRYDSVTTQLLCLSCNPTLAPPAQGAWFQAVRDALVGEGQHIEPSLEPWILIPNVTDDGNRVFFETPEALVARDVNKVQDVYEWQADDTGGCERQGGCLGLISSGRSPDASYLYGVGADGRDAFFISSEALVPGVEGGTPGIYDARIGGGFVPTTAEAECQLESCQIGSAAAPAFPEPASTVVRTGRAPCAHARKSGRGRPSRCARKRHRHHHKKHRHHGTQHDGKGSR